MTKAKPTNKDVEDAKTSLRRVLKNGGTLYGIVRTRSASGSACISPIVIVDNEPLWPSWAVACVTGYGFVEANGYGAVRMKGYGYSKIEALADAVAYALWGNEGKLKGRTI